MDESERESLQETEFWLSIPGLLNDVTKAHSALALAQTLNADDLRARLGLLEK
jgi:PHD/YefM family antitoxin component YafN of YafNO toxin-antitoxin module